MLMKKLLGIVVLGLTLCKPAFAFNYLVDLGLSSPSGFGGFIMFIIIVVLIFFGLKEGSKETKFSIFLIFCITILFPLLLFIIIEASGSIFPIFVIGFVGFLFYECMGEVRTKL